LIRLLLLFLLTAGTASAEVALTGTVVDPSGAAVGHARVLLQGATSARTVAQTTSDAAGRFHFDQVLPGRYRIEVTAGDAFTPLRREVTITATAPPPLTMQLDLAVVEESVDVTADELHPSVDTAATLDTTTLSGSALEQLPVLDQDFVGALSQYLDPGSVATGGPTIIVDGVEVKSAGIPKSAVQEIAINDDPYSAESNRPGRGRIEIITKPGTGHLRGNLGMTFRDSTLAARSYFAPVKPPEQRQAWEGVVSGPLATDGRTSFLMTFSRQSDEAAAVVHAQTPTGAFDENVATPSTNSEVMARVTHDWSDRHRGSMQLNWQRRTNTLQFAGGVVLPQAAVNSSSRETTGYFTLHSTLSPERLNQFQLTIEVNREPTRSVSNAPAIIVRDAFVSGGAQANLLRTESGGKVSDIVTISHRNHVVRFGIQVPNVNRRVFQDQTNQGGTFSFATLADYTAGRPYAYSVQQGPGRASFWWREYGAFVQDQIRISPSLQISAGLRYDWQSFFHDANNFAPRVFYDRSGVGPVAAVLLHDGVNLRSYTILDPSYPDPLAGGGSLANTPTNITVLAPDIQIPTTLQFSTTVERQLTKSTAVVVGYRGSRGHHLFRSVDVNAPLPPDYTTVPDPRFGHIQQLRSDGSLRADALEVTLRGRSGKRLSGQVQYTLGRTMNSTGGIFWFPANQYAPVNAEWGPADFDVRHRLNLLATLDAGDFGKIGASGRFASGLPYSQTVGLDLFHTSLSNARLVGVGRNSLRTPAVSTVDLRWSREVALSPGKGDKARSLTVSLDAFNIFNHPNFNGYVGNVRSPFYLSPTGVASGRRVQLGAEVKFGG
jgi:hypothetical protein